MVNPGGGSPGVISPDVRLPRRSQLNQPPAPPLKLNDTVRGHLTLQDWRNPLRGGRFAKDFVIAGGKTERRVEIRLRSQAFDAYLELISDRTGQPLLFGDDLSTRNTNARMVFTLKAGDRYRVRVSSASGGAVGGYTLISTVTSRTPSADGFNFYYGYGRVNAAAAIARVLGALPGAVKREGDRPWFAPSHRPTAGNQNILGQGITVAVIDDGVDLSHPALADNRWVNPGEIADNGIDDDGNGLVDDVSGWSFVEGNSQFARYGGEPLGLDHSEHGTHVAGIIAAKGDVGGISGVAPAAKIMALRAIASHTDTGSPQFDDSIAASITYAVNHGARVINLSLGNYIGDPAMSKTVAALRFAAQRGVVVIAAAGNERETLGAVLPIEPALYAREGLAIAVGALAGDRRMATFSNPAGDRPYPFLVAPGANIYSTGLRGGYVYKSGTSMAAPYVAGVAALMLSANPSLTPASVAAILAETADASGIEVV